MCPQYPIFLIVLLGNALPSEQLTWGSHINLTFDQLSTIVYQKDLYVFTGLDDIKNATSPKVNKNGKIVFIFPFGICIHFVGYNATEDILIRIKKNILQNNIYENIYVFITDPAMLTYSGIDQQSHQGTKLLGLKAGYYSSYDVEVTVKDYDNPTERHLCSMSNYADCVDQQVDEFFAEVC